MANEGVVVATRIMLVRTITIAIATATRRHGRRIESLSRGMAAISPTPI
jgi:hypothetical protein